jgi:cell wall-associated NlpC family hydrolase
MRDIEAERRAVVDEARSWLRTPYHHMGRAKGAGVDCATLLAEVYAGAGVLPAFDVPFYPPDWHLHREAERYLDFVLAHAVEIQHSSQALSLDGGGKGEGEARDPRPGDVALWRFGRCFSHGAIVIDWPLVVHAYAGRGCVLEDAQKAHWLAYIGGRRGERQQERPVRFFTLKRWAAVEPALRRR